MPGNDFRKYLGQRKKNLRKFHPQWDFTNEEIEKSDDLLKRDLTPICIPPSWDLVHKYAGALDENADGFDKKLYETGKVNYLGDEGEAEFLDVVRNSKIGGVLIGNINSQHLLYGRQLDPNEKEYYMLPNLIMDKLQIEVGDFEIDFLFFHETGIQHFEVKRIQKNKRTVVTKLVKDARTQIAQKHRPVLERLFRLFCKIFEGTVETFIPWEHIFCKKSIIYLTGENANDQFHHIKGNELCTIIYGKENLESVLMEKYHPNGTDSNLFKSSHLYRNFLIFLATYRPNFFISPVQCALQVHKNIFTHHINTVNYYSKNKEDILQNKAKSTKEFLQGLKVVKNIDINFGEYKDIYLTEEQMEAIGKFEGEGNFSPRLQLIRGPPGSGKSLIMMIKMFICGQMEQRKDRPIIYASLTGEFRDSNNSAFPCYRQKLDAFIKNNKSAFCRKFSSQAIWQIKDMNVLNDYFVDEDYKALSLPDSALLKDSGQMITVISTGFYGDEWVGSNFSLNSGEPNHGFECVTKLRTVFRSSRQIQRYFFEHSKNLKASISLDYLSGHNYDGVKVETHNFSNFESGLRFAEERLVKLVGIERCRKTDIGLIYGGEGRQIVQRICQRFTKIRAYDNLHYVPSLEFPVVLIVDEPFNSQHRFLFASRAICHLIVCNVIKAHVSDRAN